MSYFAFLEADSWEKPTTKPIQTKFTSKARYMQFPTLGLSAQHNTSYVDLQFHLPSVGRFLQIHLMQNFAGSLSLKIRLRSARIQTTPRHASSCIGTSGKAKD